MIKLFTQQGDCLLVIEQSIPKTAKKIQIKGNFTVLKGEGVNLHEITDCSAIEAYEDNGELYLKTSKPVDIIHSEHGRTRLEPNKIYKRIIEREFDYESMEARNTQD
jgi:hypothetical protein